jgi:hypothetical protein
MELAIVIVVMFALASCLPNKHALPREIEALSKGQRLDLPYSKEGVKMLYKISTRWRIERLVTDGTALAQYFEIFKDGSRRYRIRSLR